MCKPRPISTKRETLGVPTQKDYTGAFAVRVFNTGPVPFFIDKEEGIVLQPGDTYTISAVHPGQSLVGSLNLSSAAAGARATIEIQKEV